MRRLDALVKAAMRRLVECDLRQAVRTAVSLADVAKVRRRAAQPLERAP
jgi:hypothetical protein